MGESDRVGEVQRHGSRDRTYAVDVRVASNGAGGTFHLEVDGANATGPITVPTTGGWQVWKTITKTGVALSAGPHARGDGRERRDWIDRELQLVRDSMNGGVRWVWWAPHPL